MNKKLLVTICVAISLGFTACGSSDSTESNSTATVGKVVYAGSDFQLLTPQDWEKLEKADFTAAVSSDIVVAFRNNVKSDLFTANVSISKTVLDKEMTSAYLAASTLSKAKVKLVGFAQGDESEIDVNKGTEKVKAKLVHFSGRKSASDPVVQFDELFVVDGDTLFLLTGAYLATEDESVVKQVGEMLNSFALK